MKRIADRLAKRQTHFVRKFAGRRFAIEAAAFAGGELRHIDGFLDVAQTFDQRLAAFAGDERAELGFTLRQNLARAADYFGAFGRRTTLPCGKSFSSGFNGSVDFAGGRVGKYTNDIVRVRRIDGI